MSVYKVRIQIERIEENQNQGICAGLPYEAGEFNTEVEAERFVKNELIIVRPVKLDLLKVCRAGFKFLDSLAVTQLTSERQNREAFRKMLSTSLTRNAPLIDDRCPKCGAGCQERQLIEREFIAIEAIHVHYHCNRCGSRIIEEFKLADVFMDESPTP
jgi:hypothetical protein